MQENDSNVRWYVMQVMSGQENKVFEGIRFECQKDVGNRVVLPEDATANKYRVQFNGLMYDIFELNIPYDRIEERKQGKKTVKERKLYPGYVLIKMAMYEDEKQTKLIPENWNFIKGTKGVIGMIGGQRPVPLSEAEVKDMTRRQEVSDEQTKPRIQYHVGETVLLTEGAFENCEAVIEAIDDVRQRLKVSVSIFGRFTPVEVELWQVSRP